jgi:hypothetical protein
MSETILLPAPTGAAPDDGPAAEVTVWEHVAHTVAWLDAANGRDAHEIAVRVMKTAEEAGEAGAADIGVTGANPRKGVTASVGELAGELCDVALAALVALATVAGGTPQAEARLATHVAGCAARLDALRAAA